ncbi:coiled-coil domain-containing protein 28B [Nematostella vectensis]|nr:coiled-coil domain-containing protein 28B [Nematostella vectensis]
MAEDIELSSKATKLKSKTPKSHDKGHNLPNTSRGTSLVQTEHSFLTDRTDVKQMERGLLELMDDFNHGRLHAFGRDFTLEKMDKVRELQERVAQQHFELDNAETEADEDEVSSARNLEKLMKNLEGLSSTIQSLHQAHPD